MTLLVLLMLYLSIDPVRQIPKTAADDRTVPHVVLEGIAFHAERFGAEDGPVVVVIHGGPGGDYRSLRNLEQLAEHGYRVVFYDQRGTGLSQRVPAEQLSLQSSIDDLHRIVQWAAGEEQVALLGHSWGGIVAAYYLAEHPERVARAVLAEPGVLTSEEMQDFVERMRPRPSLGLLWLGLRIAIASMKLEGPDDEAPKDYIVEQLMTAPGDNPMNAYWCGGKPPPEAEEFWRMGATAMQAIMAETEQPDGSFAMPSLAGAKHYPGEVLLIASECNSLTGVERQRAHLPLFANARLEVIEGAGHMMFISQPERSLAVVREYFAAAPWGQGVSK
jgi:proline iminopeptidase